VKKLATAAEGLDMHDSTVRQQISEPLTYVDSYAPQDYATPQLDIELVRAFRALNRDERTQCLARMLGGNDQRMADAILRMPTILTGLSHTVLANLREAAVNRAHPEEVQRRRRLEKASSAARTMVRRVLDKLATSGRLTRQQQRELLGDAARHFPHLLV